MTAHFPQGRRPPKVRRPEPAPRVPVPAGLREPGALAGRGWPLVTAVPGRADVVDVTFARLAPDASAVLLFANRLTDETDVGASAMEPIGGGIWALTYRMEPTWRASYAFVEHCGDGPPPWESVGEQVPLRALLDRGVPDPANPRWVLNRAGHEMSVVELAAAPPQPWLAGPGVPRPPARSVGGRDVWAHRVGTGSQLPLVIHLDGEVWLDRHGLTRSLDLAHAAGALPPHVAVFAGTGSVPDRWRDAGDPDRLAADVAREVVPLARAELDASRDPRRTVVAGQSLGGLTALWAAARHGDVVGAVVAQSPSLWLSDPGPELAAGSARVHLEVGRQEWVLLPPVRALGASLAGTGVDLTVTEFNGGHDYACWRGGLLDALGRLLA